MEFNQFHPTALFHPQARNFLLTEALRGEGAYLKRPDGSRFMPDFDPRGELAPRDIVARAIDHEMKRLGVDCMYLDISHKPADFIRQHFPMIYEKLRSLGIDLTRDPVPMVCMRSARSVTPACMVRIAWHQTHCWSVLCMGGRLRKI